MQSSRIPGGRSPAFGALVTLAGLASVSAVGEIGCGATPSDPASGSSSEEVSGSTVIHPAASATLCLGVASSANGAAASVATCTGSASQQWTYDGAALRVLGTKCLDVTDGASANGTKLQIWDCVTGSVNQRWTHTGATFGWGTSGKCLDLTDGLAAAGTLAQTWSCVAGDENQEWTLGATSGGGSSSGGTSSGGTSSGGGSSSGGTTTTGLNPKVAPGANFDLSIWELQEPYGSPGAPTTYVSSQLKGASGHQSAYFFTDPTDGAMTFWDPENGVTTPNSSYPRSELREMTSSGAAANWLSPGTHTLTATLKATEIPNHVAVGQIHLGTGTPASTKPLLELFYYPSGKIEMAIEQTPAGGNEIPYTVGNVPLGTKWSYVIGLSGNTISFVLNGGATQTWQMSSTFDQEGMDFKAGDYDQSVGTSATVGAKVAFYALKVTHGK
jgi:hypothetical protein